MRWCADADISSVLYLHSTEELPLHAAWLQKDAAVAFASHVVDTSDTDRSTESWDSLNELLPTILPFMIGIIKVVVVVVMLHYILLC